MHSKILNFLFITFVNLEIRILLGSDTDSLKTVQNANMGVSFVNKFQFTYYTCLLGENETSLCTKEMKLLSCKQKVQLMTYHCNKQ